MSLKLAFYADDFTGATDTLATLALGGLRTVLFLQPPTSTELERVGPLDCVGIAGAARSMQADAQQAELMKVGAYLANTQAPVIHYKTCSTFDSSQRVGSIGVAVQLLRRMLKEPELIAYLGGQPNLGRYCVFGHLFAAYQTGGEVFRLDRHPTMSQHPVTPMMESDLRHHFAAQGLSEITAVYYPSYQADEAVLDQTVDQAIVKGQDGVLFDVSDASQLALIGRQIWQRAQHQVVLAVGPSSVEQALLAHWSVSNTHDAIAMPEKGRAVDTVKNQATTLVLSGSLSPLNAKQIAQAKSYYRVPIPIPVLDLLDQKGEPYQKIKSTLIQALKTNQSVLAHLVAPESVNSKFMQSVNSAQLAQATGALLADLLKNHHVDRLGLAGGDTSSYAIRALDVWGLSYVKQIDPGVALCQLHSDHTDLDGLQVMLKGGQMGSLDIFEKLLSGEGANKADRRLIC